MTNSHDEDLENNDIEINLDDMPEPKELELKEFDEEDEMSLDRMSAQIAKADEALAKEFEEAFEEEKVEREKEDLEMAKMDEAMMEEESSEEDELPPLQMLEDDEVMSAVEAILFLTDKSTPMKRLKDVLEGQATDEQIKAAISRIKEKYEEHTHGVELKEVAGGFQFRTKLILAPILRKMTKIQTQRLSRGAMETLSIIAFKQPVMREEIDEIRGVDSSHFLRILMDRKLIDISGRSDLPGRPMLYQTTDHFLEVFGLNTVSDMPPLQEIESMVPGSEAGNSDDENPEIKKMRKLVDQMKSDTYRIQYDPKEDESLLTEIKERVKSIASTTPFMDAKSRIEKEKQESGDRSRDVLSEALEAAYTASGFAVETPQNENAPEEMSSEASFDSESVDLN